jgi:hypothetical protein
VIVLGNSAASVNVRSCLERRDATASLIAASGFFVARNFLWKNFLRRARLPVESRLTMGQTAPQAPCQPVR